MGPRKRAKPNPKAESEPNSEPPGDVPAVAVPLPPDPSGLRLSASSTRSAGSGNDEAGSPAAGNEELNTVSTCRTLHCCQRLLKSKPRSSKGWYGGSWPRLPKASPVTQVAKESISAASGAASELVSSARINIPQSPTEQLRSPSFYLSRSMGNSSRSLPLAAATTKLSISSSSMGGNNTPIQGSQKPKDGKMVTQSVASDADIPEDRKVEELGDGTSREGEARSRSPKGVVREGIETQPTCESKSGDESSGWLNWFSKAGPVDRQDPTVAGVGQGPAHGSSVIADQSVDLATDDAGVGTEQQEQRRNSDPNPVAVAVSRDQQPKSWLGFWGNAASSQEKTEAKIVATSATEPTLSERVETVESQALNPKSVQINPSLPPASQSLGQIPDSTRFPGWTFWSRDQPKGQPSEGGLEDEVGKLALAGSSLQSQPQPQSADVNEIKGLIGAAPMTGKRERPQSLDVSQGAIMPGNQKIDGHIKKTSQVVPIKPKVIETPEAKSKKANANLLLPAFKRTYHIVESPGWLQQLGRFLRYNRVPDSKHVDLLADPARVTTALAIGIHGYFPAPLIRSVLGQPTGTSIRFANCAANAIQKWTQDHGYSCEVEKVALEGEGRIAERIDLLWKLMLNWIENIRKADFVMIACHSQGVPVAMMLVAKLIAFGCVNTARIGVCAMAGVNLGPFVDYKSRWISGSAGELFEFARPDSQVSKDYRAALEIALRFGVRIVYVGSIDDQLVSLQVSSSYCV